jgi:hypothetical protein
LQLSKPARKENINKQNNERKKMETNNITTTEADPMDLNVSDIDTSFPRIIANVYELEIETAECVDNKAGTGQNLKVGMKTTAPATSTTGETLPAGVKLTSNISLTPTEKYSKQSIAKAVASLAQSASMTGTPREILSNPMNLVGKLVTAKVGIQKETDEYPESNTVKAFVAKK